MTTTSTSTPTATDLATRMFALAQTVCASFAVVNEETVRGEPHTWIHAPTPELTSVLSYQDTVLITMAVNRLVTKAESTRIVREATLACTLAWAAAGLLPNNKYQPIRTAGALTWSLGFHHMNQWCPTAMRRGVKVPA